VRPRGHVVRRVWRDEAPALIGSTGGRASGAGNQGRGWSPRASRRLRQRRRRRRAMRSVGRDLATQGRRSREPGGRGGSRNQSRGGRCRSRPRAQGGPVPSAAIAIASGPGTPPPPPSAEPAAASPGEGPVPSAAIAIALVPGPSPAAPEAAPRAACAAFWFLRFRCFLVSTSPALTSAKDPAEEVGVAADMGQSADVTHCAAGSSSNAHPMLHDCQ
jgi:hypothetical protein